VGVIFKIITIRIALLVGQRVRLALDAEPLPIVQALAQLALDTGPPTKLIVPILRDMQELRFVIMLQTQAVHLTGLHQLPMLAHFTNAPQPIHGKNTLHLTITHIPCVEK
jgi:hypothetical protein